MITDKEKLEFILEKELEIVIAISNGHKASNSDKFQKDRDLMKKYRLDLGLIKATKIK